MRELLFRGQTRRKGEKVFAGTGKPVDSEWVYGGVFQGKGDFSIIYGYEPIEKYSVYTDTVGQFTGFTDKNGKKIFEGDIVRYNDGVFYVEYYAPHMAFYFHGTQGRGSANGFTRTSNDIEVIGNIHDNPELLEK